jgi:hypothetical protein
MRRIEGISNGLRSVRPEARGEWGTELAAAQHYLALALASMPDEAWLALLEIEGRQPWR